MNPTRIPELETAFRVRCASVYDGCLTVGAATAVYTLEGVKAVEARRRLGLPEPKVEGKPLSSFVTARFSSGTEMEAFALIVARRTALGTYSLAHGHPGALEAALVSDREFAAALRQRLELLEG